VIASLVSGPVFGDGVVYGVDLLVWMMDDDHRGKGDNLNCLGPSSQV